MIKKGENAEYFIFAWRKGGNSVGVSRQTAPIFLLECSKSWLH